jgi:hypothetical protein
MVEYNLEEFKDPDLASQPDIQTPIAKQGATPKPMVFNELNFIDPDSETKKPSQESDFMSKIIKDFKNALVGIKTSIGPTLRGLGQLAEHDPRYSFLQPKRAVEHLVGTKEEEELAYKQAKAESPKSAMLGYGLGTVAEAGVLPTGKITATGKFLAPLAKKVTKTALGMGALGAAKEGDIQERAKRGAEFAKMGAIGAGVLGTGGKLISAGARKILKKPPGEAKKFLTQYMKFKPTVGQVTGREALQSLEMQSAKIPLLGLKGKFKEQVSTIQKEVSKVIKGVERAESKTLAPQAVMSLNKQIQKSISSSYDKQKLLSNTLYRKFTKSIEDTQHIKLKLPNLQREANRIIRKQTELTKEGLDIAIEDPKLVNLYSQLASKSQLTPKNIPILRQKIGTFIDQYKVSNPSLSRDLVKLKTALDQDLGNFAKNVGGRPFRLYQEAQQHYASKVAPFKEDRILSSVLKGKIDADQIMNYMIKNERPELVSRIMARLNPTGRAQVRQALYKKILRNSLDPEDKIDLLKFHKNIRNLGDTLKGSLTKTQYTQIQGLQKLIANFNEGIKAGQSKEFLVQGMFGMGGLVLSAMATKAFVVMGATVMGGTRMLASPRTSNLLIKAAKLPVGSPKLQRISNIIFTGYLKSQENK